MASARANVVHGWDSLDAISPRARDILQLVVIGASNKEIAYDLGVSCISVKHYITGLLRTAGVSTRTELSCVYFGHPTYKPPQRREAA